MRVGSVSTGVLPISRRQVPKDLQSPRLALAPRHQPALIARPRAFPKRQYSAENLQAVANELNDRPRKALDWDSPAERLCALLEQVN